ncbi:hypothetical protein [Planctomycetes bacterium CA13]|uniref:hypothetical protein n=1 Tax=Novipirellula herctigrandis TaxID=2527986 RepID=UPI0011B683E6
MFNRKVGRVLTARVTEIRFKPQMDRDFVMISDPELIVDIQGRIAHSDNLMMLAPHPSPHCPLQFHFDDGTEIELRMSITGKLRRYLNELHEPGVVRVPSYVTIEYDGTTRLLRNQPFTDYLKSRGLVDSPNPEPISMYNEPPDGPPLLKGEDEEPFNPSRDRALPFDNRNSSAGPR